MRISFDRPKDNSWNLLRQAGYSPHPDRRGSFYRSVYGGLYPRFHIYVEEEVSGVRLIITLHLDQKRPSHKGSTPHGGVYDGELIEEEAKRLLEIWSK